MADGYDGVPHPPDARASGLRMAAAMNHFIDGTERLAHHDAQSSPDSARVVATDVLEPGQKLRIVKLVAYGWSHERTQPAMRDQVAAALVAARDGRLGRAPRRAARLPRRLLGAPATSSSTATPSCSRRCASRSSRCSRRARAPRARPSRPRD